MLCLNMDSALAVGDEEESATGSLEGRPWKKSSGSLEGNKIFNGLAHWWYIRRDKEGNYLLACNKVKFSVQRFIPDSHVAWVSLA